MIRHAEPLRAVVILVQAGLRIYEVPGYERPRLKRK
jgi:hypothetical protein